MRTGHGLPCMPAVPADGGRFVPGCTVALPARLNDHRQPDRQPCTCDPCLKRLTGTGHKSFRPQELPATRASGHQTAATPLRRAGRTVVATPPRHVD